jgi:uronate dehydrogenase
VVPRPDGAYGVSKVFGEAVGALHADKYGMRVLSLRIGNVGPVPLDRRRLAIWLHPDDLIQLLAIGFEHPDIRYEVFYGASLNERAWWDNANAYRFGYRPRHRAEDHRDHALAEQAKLPADPVGDFYQGGSFCSAGFAGDASRVW